MSKWPHAPSHEVTHPGSYIITAATHKRQRLFNDAQRLDLLEGVLLETLEEMGWSLQAWAVFPNHYHFVGQSPEQGLELTELTKRVHRITATALNRLDDTLGRTVWYRAWDTRISFPNSYLARLAYVHANPVHHGIVQRARDWKWCSAEWFYVHSNSAFYETVNSFRTDRVNVRDFDCEEL